jgi:hypothetical protein
MTRLAKRAICSIALWVGAVRLLVCHDGATAEERSRRFPGDELVPGKRGSTMAVSIAAPPSAVWPWLVQMGSDRGGFYSWDLLDNGGDPSATEIHPEWQGLAVGDRMPATPDSGIWFDVIEMRAQRLLVLWSRLDLARMKSVPGGEVDPPFSSKGIWTFVLEHGEDGGTRLIVRANGEMRPRIASRLFDLLLFDALHWVMQRRQLANLRRRAEAISDLDAERPQPLVASPG